MTTVIVRPMPEAYRQIKKKIYRPMHPPIFTDIDPGGPTADDWAQAREPFEILDEESKNWYRRLGCFKD